VDVEYQVDGTIATWNPEAHGELTIEGLDAQRASYTIDVMDPNDPDERKRTCGTLTFDTMSVVRLSRLLSAKTTVICS